MSILTSEASTATPEPSDQRAPEHTAADAARVEGHVDRIITALHEVDEDDNASYLPDLTRECEQRGLDLQLTDDPAVDLPEIKTIDGRLTLVARADQLGVALDEVRLTYRQAAVFVTNRLEAEAVKTADPAETLGNILDTLPEVMPEVFHKMGTPAELAEALRPEVTNRVRFIRDLYRARAKADPAYAEILNIMLDATRDGADPADVSSQVLELMQQACA